MEIELSHKGNARYFSFDSLFYPCFWFFLD